MHLTTAGKLNTARQYNRTWACPVAEQHGNKSAAVKKENYVRLVSHPINQVSAHRPLELTRMAVHGACGREMATALREYRAWNARRSNGGGYGGGCGGGGHGNGGKSAPQVRSLLARGRPGVDVGVGVGKRAREAASNERVSELQRTPTGWRALRWMMMKRQAELKNQVAEAAAMYAEEMEQRLKER